MSANPMNEQRNPHGTRMYADPDTYAMKPPDTTQPELTPSERVEAKVEDARNISLWISTGKHGMTLVDNGAVVPAQLAFALAAELEAAQERIEELELWLKNASDEIMKLKGESP